MLKKEANDDSALALRAIADCLKQKRPGASAPGLSFGGCAL
jgi:hypothetical protein